LSARAHHSETLTISLYCVPGGTMRTHPISDAEF
jgi:hypothetical protein